MKLVLMNEYYPMLSMTKINEEYLTTYWADGLIIATLAQQVLVK